MALIFFSPELKSTPSVDYYKHFDLSCRKSSCKTILKECDAARKRILLLLSKKSTSAEELDQALKSYVGAIGGLVFEPEGAAGSKPSKLSKTGLSIRWQNIIGPEFSDSADLAFELYNMLANYCLWHLRAAALNTITDPFVQLTDTTLLFRKLRMVAGVWDYITNNGMGARQGDVMPEVARVYGLLTLAQAEEITLQMGLSKRSPHDYLSKVASDIAAKYGEAAKTLAGAKQPRCEKLYYYLIMKSDIHMAYAYALYGAFLLDKEDGGRAVKCQQAAVMYLERSYKSAAEYMKGDRYFKESAVYAKVKRFVQLHESKAKNDNAMLYRKPIPSEPVQLETAQAAVRPDVWTLPSLAPLWSKEIYDSFDVHRLKR